MPVVIAARRSSEGECERNIVVAASKATATNPEINRLHGNLRSALTGGHCITANGCFQMWSASPITMLFLAMRARLFAQMHSIMRSKVDAFTLNTQSVRSDRSDRKLTLRVVWQYSAAAKRR